jgi:hypothetical protein
LSGDELPDDASYGRAGRLSAQLIEMLIDAWRCQGRLNAAWQELGCPAERAIPPDPAANRSSGRGYEFATLRDWLGRSHEPAVSFACWCNERKEESERTMARSPLHLLDIF